MDPVKLPTLGASRTRFCPECAAEGIERRSAINKYCTQHHNKLVFERNRDQKINPATITEITTMGLAVHWSARSSTGFEGVFLARQRATIPFIVVANSKGMRQVRRDRIGRDFPLIGKFKTIDEAVKAYSIHKGVDAPTTYATLQSDSQVMKKRRQFKNRINVGLHWCMR